jgi:hypothetical protein
MLALSTYLGHAKVADTYWYLEAASGFGFRRNRPTFTSCRD